MCLKRIIYGSKLTLLNMSKFPIERVTPLLILVGVGSFLLRSCIIYSLIFWMSLGMVDRFISYMIISVLNYFLIKLIYIYLFIYVNLDRKNFSIYNLFCNGQ